MVETKYYCDICGREAPVSKYKIPEIHSSFYCGESEGKKYLDVYERDVCEDCIMEIAKEISNIKTLKMSETYKRIGNADNQTFISSQEV